MGNLIDSLSVKSSPSKWRDLFQSQVEHNNLYKRELLLEKTDVKLSFDNIIFPTIRRVFAQTLALDITPVQPMAAPVGNTFYMDFNYGKGDLYKKCLLVEKIVKNKEKYTPNYRNKKFVSPGVYTIEYDINVSPGFPDSTIKFL